MVTAGIVGLGSALPTPVGQEELWEQFFADEYASHPLAEQIWNNVGVQTRHAVVVPFKEDLREVGTEARMDRFVEEGLRLGRAAVGACLDDAGLRAADVDHLTVVTCTGYATPGIDILLARDLGMPSSLERLHVGHMGCYAALPALASVSDAVTARGKTAVLLCLELSSLHARKATGEVDQVVAHSLFADAAAAVAVRPGAGLGVVDVAARTDSAKAEMMTWRITDRGFEMGLSPRVPEVLEEHVEDLVDGLLSRHGLRRSDVSRWAVHPGGPRIVDVVAERLGLSEEDVLVSRAVLRDCGNCSSATILLILQRMLGTQPLAHGEHLVALAFGPGLTLYAALLRQSTR